MTNYFALKKIRTRELLVRNTFVFVRIQYNASIEKIIFNSGKIACTVRYSRKKKYWLVANRLFNLKGL